MSYKFVQLDRQRYEKDRSWSDKYIPMVAPILGPLLFRVATHNEDTKHATDLNLVTMPNLAIAVRFRRSKYVGYKHDFTMRNSVGNSDDSEFEKIKKGAADWFFYAHIGVDNKISIWHLIDLHAFRHPSNASLLANCQPIPNRDGSSFVAFDYRQFAEEPSILVASSLEDRGSQWTI